MLVGGAAGLPPARTVALILLCMVFARTAAMVFNRLADWEIDQRNPRTAGRHRLVARPGGGGVAHRQRGGVRRDDNSVHQSAVFRVVAGGASSSSGFLFADEAVSPITRSFSSGFALAVSPVGAWLAVRGHFDWPPLVLAGAVLLWVAGFDLIYATMDFDFDRAAGLRSLVVRCGIPGSLRLAQVLHAAAFLGLAAFGWAAGMGGIYFAGLALVLGAFFYEHRSVAGPAPLDVGVVNAAFFHANAFVGLVFVLAVFGDECWRH